MFPLVLAPAFLSPPGRKNPVTPLMALPKKGISCAQFCRAMSEVLSTATVAISCSFPSSTRLSSPHRLVAPEVSSNPLGLLPRSRLKRYKGPSRDDSATDRTARPSTSRLRAQFRLLETNGISLHLRPAFIAMWSAPVLSVAVRGEEVLTHPQGGYQFDLTLVWVDRWGQGTLRTPGRKPTFGKADPTVLVRTCAQKRLAVGGCIARQRRRGGGSRCQRRSFDGHSDPSPARLACTK